MLFRSPLVPSPEIRLFVASRRVGSGKIEEELHAGAMRLIAFNLGLFFSAWFARNYRVLMRGTPFFPLFKG